MKYKVLLLLFDLALLFVACGKQPEGQGGYEPYDTHPYWTDSNPDAFWDKQPDGLRLDTVWEGDTTINF